MQFYLQSIVDRGPLVEGGPAANRWSDPMHRKYRSRDEVMTCTDLELRNPKKERIHFVRSGEPLVIRLHYRAFKDGVRPIFGVGISTESGTVVSRVSTWLCGVDIPDLAHGDGYITLH